MGAGAAGAGAEGAGAGAGRAGAGAGSGTDGSCGAGNEGTDGSCGAGSDGAGTDGTDGSDGTEGRGGSGSTDGSWACAVPATVIASTAAMPSPGLCIPLHHNEYHRQHLRQTLQKEDLRTLRSMADWDDVDRLARALPGVDESTSYGNRAWKVKDKAFAWERPLRRSDLEALGDDAPDGPILGVRVEHLVAKEALLADDPGVYFTTPHFDGYPAVLVRLGAIERGELEELLAEAWLCRAPKRLAKAFLDERVG